jgi:hypothetical protein
MKPTLVEIQLDGTVALDCERGRSHGHYRSWDASMRSPPHHTARNEYRMVLATIPVPANRVGMKTGLSRPGTTTVWEMVRVAGSAS